MVHSYSLSDISLPNSWLTIGVFDGIHSGHQQIIRTLTAGAHENGVPAVVLTFFPHPAQVLGGVSLKYLTMPQERAEILHSMGVDVVITHPFDQATAQMTAEEFMALLKEKIGLQTLLVGYDFALGRNRTGTIPKLTELGQTLGYRVLPVDALQHEGRVLSSSLIRQLIGEGDVRGAALRLGRNYSLQGPIIRGDGRGRTIGIPTANVDVPSEKAVPANGVYACWAIVNGEKHKAVVNIGVRPTFTTGEVAPRVEAHLLEYSADLYDQTLVLQFVERLRGEQKFAGIDALVAQIKADVAHADDVLSQ